MSDLTKILVIFDLDFTLIDNSFAICKAFNYALESFQINPPMKEKIIEKIGIELKDMFLDYLDDANAERGVHLFRQYYRTHFFEGVKIIPGAIDLLEKLQGLRYKLALLTSKKTELAIKLLEYIDLKKYFDFILGEQQEFKPKPNPEPILYILSKFPKIDKVFMIGDHDVDCLSAKNAGINFIGVLSGNTSEKNLRKCAGEDAIIIKHVGNIDPPIHLI
ncbi:MAG: HAD family hydrolase [Candidatus Helarchaeota archaeon]|nr:HAD family hydrolase [Candidatus Helarchaeota archaeon]